MVQSEELGELFSINYSALSANIDGVTHAESLLSPHPGGNNLNWVVGHIVMSRGVILNLMTDEELLTPAEARPYKRGSHSGNNNDLLSFDILRTKLDQSEERLHEALKQQTPETLEKTNKRKKKEQQPLGKQLLFLHFHEAYHVGQTGLLRRLVGKEGAIQ